MKPKVGDIWEVRRPNRRMIRKEIGSFGKIWIGDYESGRKVPWIYWRREPKGRYSGITVSRLLEFGKLISTKAERDAKIEAHQKRMGLIVALILACLCLAPVQRKGAQILVDLAKHAGADNGSKSRTYRAATSPASTISNLYSADFARSFILRTHYPAPSPVAGPQEAPTVKAVPISRATQAPPTNRLIVLPQFVFTNTTQNWWWHRLEADTLAGPWRTNEKNMRMPPSGTVRLVRTNARGFFRMMGTMEPL